MAIPCVCILNDTKPDRKDVGVQVPGRPTTKGTDESTIEPRARQAPRTGLVAPSDRVDQQRYDHNPAQYDSQNLTQVAVANRSAVKGRNSMRLGPGRIEAQSLDQEDGLRHEPVQGHHGHHERHRVRKGQGERVVGPLHALGLGHAQGLFASGASQEPHPLVGHELPRQDVIVYDIQETYPDLEGVGHDYARKQWVFVVARPEGQQRRAYALETALPDASHARVEANEPDVFDGAENQV